MPIQLIFNPTANQGKKLHLLPHIVKKLSISEKDVYITSGIKDAEKFAAHSAKNGFSPIVCAGGDGILNAVINGVLSVSKTTPVGFIPIGMNNVGALSAGISLDITQACQTILKGNIRKIDIGKVSAGKTFRYFFTMIDFGLTARVVHKAEKNIKLKKIFRKLLYLYWGLFYLFSGRFTPLNVVFNNQEKKAYLVVIANGSYYGGNRQITPDADMFDGLLNLCLFTRGSRTAFLKYFTEILLGNHLTFKNVSQFTTNKIIVTSRKIPSHVDGEPFLSTPCTIEIAPKILPFLLP